LLTGHDDLSGSSREQLTIADEEADHLTQLLNDAIEIARLDTEHIQIHPALSDLGTIVHEVVASMKIDMEDRPLEIQVDEGIPLVPVDRRLLKLAMKQLVDNAIKYSPADAPVLIRVGRCDGGVFVEVIDRGQGIQIEEQMRIFERFYRGHSVKTQIPGSGLGLSIAHRIMQAHQGDLSVTSRPGETTFRMTLPLEQLSAGPFPPL
jgi:two-component system phosphate regulon sensor histidine kinase PhoR